MVSDAEIRARIEQEIAARQRGETGTVPEGGWTAELQKAERGEASEFGPSDSSRRRRDEQREQAVRDRDAAQKREQEAARKAKEAAAQAAEAERLKLQQEDIQRAQAVADMEAAKAREAEEAVKLAEEAAKVAEAEKLKAQQKDIQRIKAIEDMEAARKKEVGAGRKKKIEEIYRRLDVAVGGILPGGIPFIERTPEKDADERDRLYVVGPGGVKAFETPDYQREMAKCNDVAVRARFMAATKRQDIF